MYGFFRKIKQHTSMRSWRRPFTKSRVAGEARPRFLRAGRRRRKESPTNVDWWMVPLPVLLILAGVDLHGPGRPIACVGSLIAGSILLACNAPRAVRYAGALAYFAVLLIAMLR